MKNKKLAKLRYNMWLYFIVFAIIIIATIWIFQILLFDRIYQQRKQQTLIKTGEEFSEILNTEDEISDKLLNSWLKTAVEANEAGILSYLAYKNSNGKLVVETIFTGFVSDQTSSESSSETDTGNKTNEEQLIDVSDEVIVNIAIEKLEMVNTEYVCYRSDDNASAVNNFYIFATKVNNPIIKEGYLVLKTSQQALVDTINVIQTQLIVVTAFVVAIAFFISWYIATKLSNPIIKMSTTAKQWANGDESIEFKGDSYQELSELADTLNYAKEGISQTGILQRDLLANVSHDLKTPLTMIKAYAEMIRDLSGDIKEKRDLHTQVIIDEADRLTMLVNDILDLSRIQNKFNQLNIQKVNLSQLCERVLHRFNDFAERSGYKIEKSIKPDIYVECDEKKIEQVIYNLVGNSINYTGLDKTIYVRLDSQDGEVMFESVDSGKGISKENIETIWEKYYRFSETHQRPIKGTGLGLSIVKSILEAHNLKFGVISKKDIGSNFFIQFKEIQVG